ncbi:MAG: hypothetical protein H6737_18220 [Alphaproteobacteria bacterium]|nr:hypothetical protein [Alphaproteobacteria bacterium]
MQSRADESHVWLRWLTRLRWVALGAQAVTLAFAFPLLDSFTVLVPMGVLMLALLVANVRAMQVLARKTPIHELTLLWQLTVDVLSLTGFFVLGGGPDNPFVVLYFIHIAMGSIMLRPSLAALLALLALASYSLLHLWHLPLHFENHTIEEGVLRPIGQLLAFVVSTISVAVFVVGLADTLRRRKEQLLEARDRTSRTDRLRSVGTMAAGAAHELNTPLSTIGLRIRRIGRRYDDPDTARDLEVMKAQLHRCTRIVQQLLAGAGDPSAVGMEQVPLSTLVTDAVKLWEKGSTLELEVVDESREAEVNLPRVAFAQALTNLLENAREAQESVDDYTPLSLRIGVEGEEAVIELRDHGCGLPKEPDQVGTPFFTTKSAGTGLGVFVARQVADGAGGGLRYITHPDGTTARWWFPVAPRRIHEPEGHPTEAVGGG